MDVRRLLRGVGTALLAMGVLILLFVAYELWGTGLITAGHQRALRQQFESQLRSSHPTTTTAPTAPTTTTLPVAGVQPPAAGGPPANGQPVGIIQIPKIGVDYVVVQGTNEADLQAGPGHYTGTAMPGNPGNAAIAGHRTTYLHPFYNLDALSPGDRIYVTTPQGRFLYRVTGSTVVPPTQVSVLDPTPTPTLTLTTCNPRYSAATRLVVTAALVTPEVPPTPPSPGGTGTPGTGPPPTPVATPAPAADTLTGTGGGWVGALVWGLACLALATGVWLVHRRLRHWWVYLVGACGLLVLLFFFFGAVNPLLPQGY